MLYIKQIYSETYQMKCLYIKQIAVETYKPINLKAVPDSCSIQRQFCFKPIPDITFTSNKISKNSFDFLATIINSLKKNPQNLSIKTPPKVTKKGK